MADASKYKVRFFQDNIYEIIESTLVLDGDILVEKYETKVFQGTLPECNAWIQLRIIECL